MLALVAALMLAADPALIKDPGFQLSFLGTAGILLLAEPIGRRLPGPRLFVEPFAVTVAAQLATLPIMGGTFGVIALAGPVANALVLPLLPFMMITGGAGAILNALLPGMGWMLLQVTGLGASAVVSLPVRSARSRGRRSRWVTGRRRGPSRKWLGYRWGWPSLPSPSTGGLRSRRRSERAVDEVAAVTLRDVVAAGLAAVLAASAAWAVASRPDGRLHVTVLATGSSPAVLVQAADGSQVLVDGGAAPSLLLAALGRVLPAGTSILICW